MQKVKDTPVQQAQPQQVDYGYGDIGTDPGGVFSSILGNAVHDQRRRDMQANAAEERVAAASVRGIAAAPRVEPKGWPFEAGVRMQQRPVNHLAAAPVAAPLVGYAAADAKKWPRDAFPPYIPQKVDHLAAAPDAPVAWMEEIEVVGNHVPNRLEDRKPTIDHINEVIGGNVPGVGTITGEDVEGDGLCGARALYRGAKGRQATRDQALKLRDMTLKLAVFKDTAGKLWVVEKFGEDFVLGMLMSHRELNELPTIEAKLLAWKRKMELPPADAQMPSYTWADELFMYVAAYALKVCLVVLRLGEQNAWQAPDFWHHVEFSDQKIVMLACLNQQHCIHLDSDDTSKMKILCNMDSLRVDNVALGAAAQIPPVNPSATPSANPSANAAVTEKEYLESMQAAYEQGVENGRKLEADSWQNAYESLGQSHTLLEEENKALKCDLLDAVTSRSQMTSHIADLEGTVAYLQSLLSKQQEEIQQLQKMQPVVDPVGEPVQDVNALLDGFNFEDEAAGGAEGEVGGDVEALLQGFNSDEDSDAGNVSAGATPAEAGKHERVDPFAALINFNAGNVSAGSPATAAKHISWSANLQEVRVFDNYVDTAPAASWTMPGDWRTRDEINAQALLDALESQQIAIAAEEKAKADKTAVEAQAALDAQAAVDAQPKPGLLAGFASMFASSSSTEVPAPAAPAQVAPAPAAVAQPAGPPPPPPRPPTEADLKAASASQGEKNQQVASQNEAALQNQQAKAITQAVVAAAQAAGSADFVSELAAKLAKRRPAVAGTE
jgi:hypothetical protein